MSKTFIFQVIQFNQTVQFSISMQFSSIEPIDRALSGVTILSQSGPGSNGNEGVLCIPQSSSTAGTSPSDCLVSYPRHLLGGVLLLCRGTVGVFYRPSWLGKGNWKNQGKELTPSPTSQYSSYWKESLWVTLDDSQPTYILVSLYILLMLLCRSKFR